MLKLEQALLVEGKYDAARLSNIVDGTILTTDGFRVFKDGALQRLLKRIAAAQGLIILTDSDAAGFKIRHFVTGLVGADHVLQAYVPAIAGKESRKAEPGKEGLLHISEIAWKRLETVEEAGISEGDTIQVKLLEVDEKTGKFRLSHRVLEEKPEGWEDRPARRPRREGGEGRPPRRPRND